jgi:hypothetical protein
LRLHSPASTKLQNVWVYEYPVSGKMGWHSR